MLKEHFVTDSLIDALEQMPGYVMFMKYMVTKKRSVSGYHYRLQHCSVISTRPLV